MSFDFFVASRSAVRAMATAIVTRDNENRPKKASFLLVWIRTFQSRVKGIIRTGGSEVRSR